MSVGQCSTVHYTIEWKTLKSLITQGSMGEMIILEEDKLGDRHYRYLVINIVHWELPIEGVAGGEFNCSSINSPVLIYGGVV